MSADLHQLLRMGGIPTPACAPSISSSVSPPSRAPPSSAIPVPRAPAITSHHTPEDEGMQEGMVKKDIHVARSGNIVQYLLGSDLGLILAPCLRGRFILGIGLQYLLVECGACPMPGNPHQPLHVPYRDALLLELVQLLYRDPLLLQLAAEILPRDHLEEADTLWPDHRGPLGADMTPLANATDHPPALAGQTCKRSKWWLPLSVSSESQRGPCPLPP
ncbi:hypothetical protein J5N97_018071 [Dioscorea zingiberensis]|uniref:Uncharacterized protein n=1 Tax=Dioscorea zingiberensis TaxID=325984 RepID=A0A9D5CMK0_9LILI|nr:hypothetical protein J5N97_018071 [Dioscorea zingiberensis]